VLGVCGHCNSTHRNEIIINANRGK
jgi:hypothetical protein